MRFKWEKLGLIFETSVNGEISQRHAQGPTGIIFNNKIRVFYSSRPEINLTLPYYFDFDFETFSIVNQCKKPILDLGSPGNFDEHGIIPKYLVCEDDSYYLYYIGWSRKVGVPYTLNIGLAKSEDCSIFSKPFQGPILGIDHLDPYSCTAPCVFKEENIFYMYYTSGKEWLMVNGKLEHTYTIRRAKSIDGINWIRDHVDVVKQINPYECISNPTIVKIDGYYHMWYCFKGSFNFRFDKKQSYRIGYAYSTDNLNWTRDDKNSGITISENHLEFDSLMIEYPNVFHFKNEIYMLYNGNGFGETGIGLAKLKIFDEV